MNVYLSNITKNLERIADALEKMLEVPSPLPPVEADPRRTIDLDAVREAAVQGYRQAERDRQWPCPHCDNSVGVFYNYDDCGFCGRCGNPRVTV